MSLTSSSHILVVDDDRALRHAVSSLLERNGHTVLQAGDGPAALAHLARTDVQLMLLDMGLPGMTGLDLLARVRAGDRHPIVVVITADDTPETLLAAIRAQAYRYVKKPVSPAAIVEVVEETLQASNAATLPIEVISARPEWVEIVAPCVIEMADRLQSFVMQLEMSLPEDVRESVAQAFRELLLNAIEWGGKLESPTARTIRSPTRSYARKRDFVRAASAWS